MGYAEVDQLAINTIRILAVSPLCVPRAPWIREIHPASMMMLGELFLRKTRPWAGLLRDRLPVRSGNARRACNAHQHRIIGKAGLVKTDMDAN